MRYLTFIFLLCLLSFSHAHAQDAAIEELEQNKKSLESLKSDLSEKKEKSKEIEKSVKEREKELKDLKSDMVALSAKVQEQQSDLAELNKRISENEKHQDELREALGKNAGRTSNLLLAAAKMERTPKEAYLFREGGDMKAAVRTSTIMAGLFPAMRKESEELSYQLNQYAAVLKALENDRAAQKRVKEKLDGQMAELDAMMQGRTALVSSTRADFQKLQKETEAIAGRAGSLEELVSKLEAEEAARVRVNPPTKPSFKGISTSNSAAPLRPANIKDGRQPVPGTIQVAYGAPDSFGARSEGIRVATSPGALVVAPLSGVVKFAGPFRGYGQLIMIDHGKDTMSLIGGLGQLQVTAGQQLQGGEPIGSMPNDNSASMYYELRQQGQTRDPTQSLNY